MDDENNRVLINVLSYCIQPRALLRQSIASVTNADSPCKQTLRRRLPPVNLPGGMLNLKAFKSAPYSVYTVSGFLAFLGLYTG
jgi:hypothetical protein